MRWQVRLGDERARENREEGGGSHSASFGGVGWLGEASEQAGGEGDLRRPEEEEGVGDVVTELLAAHGVVQRMRGSRRSSWHIRMGVGRLVVAAIGDGGSGFVRW